MIPLLVLISVLLPKPAMYVTDLSSILNENSRLTLNEKLAQFERDTSNQVVVYIAPKMPVGSSSIEEVANKNFHEWGIGQKGKDNGVLFMVFTQDRKMRIEVGYGLEASLTDYRCNQILAVTKEFFRNANWQGGIENAVSNILVDLKPVYQGTGKTQAEAATPQGTDAVFWTLIFFGIGAAIVGIGVWLRNRYRPEIPSVPVTKHSHGYYDPEGKLDSFQQEQTQRQKSRQQKSSASVYVAPVTVYEAPRYEPSPPSPSSSDSSPSGSSDSSFSGGGGDSGGGGSSSDF